MPSLKTYDLFISHGWKYGDDYNRLVNLLENAPNFNFRNYSAPQHNPLKNLDGSTVTNKSQITDAIDRKIKPVNAVLIISGMYYNHSDWMSVELLKALRYNKPIIALLPYHHQNIPFAIRSTAVDVVAWNTDSIINAIRKYSI